MSDEYILLNKFSYQSDRQSLVAQTERAQLAIGHLENDIKKFKELLTECFENAIAPLGAGETINPDTDSKDLAQRVFEAIKK